MRATAHFSGSLRIAVFVSVIAFTLASGCYSGTAGEGQMPSGAPWLDVQPLEPAPYKMLDHRKLLFATSRQVVPNSDEVARSKPGGSVMYEKVFLDTISPSIAYGWVEVGYPSDRHFDQQNYNPDPSHPNPFSYFSIESFGMVGTRQAAQQLVEKQGFDRKESALVFVHGIDNSFSDAAERLTQLVVDMKVKGAPVLFSWPSETGVPVFRISPRSYRDVLANAKYSEPYLAQAIYDILSDKTEHFDLLAHSMGTLVAFDVLKQLPPLGVNTLDPHMPPPLALPNIVLAAPDIGMNQFELGRKELLKRTHRLTIYCGSDTALFFSKQVNGEDRLGYCSEAKQHKDYMDGVEFVRVYGRFRDWFRHSYYINCPPVVRDIKNAISAEKEDPTKFTGSIRLPYREILLGADE